MLIRLMMLEDYGIKKVSRDIAATFAGLNSQSAAFRILFMTLLDDGMIDISMGMVRLTEAGKSFVNVPSSTDANEALHRLQQIATMGNQVIAPHSDAIVARLYDGQEHSKKALAEACGYKNIDSRGFKSVLITLKKIGLLDVDPYVVKLKNCAFPFGPLTP
ncbi:hypothetical protein MPSEU_000958500 [Mayamaea pseudoterrestris]|nr:hypothetical protein MPSEU_000958500 [Mayamaea pseudoterrestris]